MKKGLLSSYIHGIVQKAGGEGYRAIFCYFFPEFISALLLYSMPFLLDSYFISHLESTTAYVTLGTTNNIVHFIIKLAEAFSIGTLVLTGQFNGGQQYQKAGNVMKDAFWVTCIVGLFFTVTLYMGAHWIYAWYGVPTEVIPLGVPFLRLRSISILLIFVYLACVGFLRGIKNSRVPMKISTAGIIIFIGMDYALIFGKWGFAPMGLNGSAVASIIQYSFMLIIMLGYILLNKKNRKYGITLFSGITRVSYVKRLLALSWPVILDKATMAGAYIWLCKMICPMGTNAVAAFCVVKDMERFAFLPAIAFSQVLTFLVSNDFGAGNWAGIKSNIKKITFISGIMVFAILVLFSFNVEYIAHFFDKKGEFTLLTAQVFPLLSVLVFFDLIQLLLAAALRGAGDVRLVMYVRLLVCLGYFVPISYFLSYMQISSEPLRFMAIYGSFYIGNALMSIAYVSRLCGEDWKKSAIKGNV